MLLHSQKMKKSQLLFAPCPGMGHLVSIVEFAKLLINHNGHLSITVLIIRAPFDPTVDAYTQSLTSSASFPKRLRFLLLPSHPNPANSHSLHPFLSMDSLIQNHKPSVRDAVSNLNSGPDSPPLAGFIVDMFCTTMIDVANEFGVPSMVFFTSGAASLGMMLHSPTLVERENVDTTALNFKNSGAEFAIPSFANLVPASVFPLALTSDKEWRSCLLNHARGHEKAKGILVNSFEELEPYAIRSFSNGDIAVHPVGPILSGVDNSSARRGSDDDVLGWLDHQPPSSVLFLCFGSRGCFDDDDQVTEIARALERSGVRFVWSLRKPPPKGSMKPPSDYSNVEEVLPEGFTERTAEIGRVIGWARQAQILAHEAVGGFVSHCGWNSILESIYHGVPIATWPLYSEQQVNAFELIRELELGVEISLDYTIEFDGVRNSEVISAERIEKGIKQVMQNDSEVRKKVKQMSELSRHALMEGGSSHCNLRRVIDDFLS